MATEKCSSCGEEADLQGIPAPLTEDVLWECPKCGTRNTLEAEEVTHVTSGDGGNGGDKRK